MRRALVIPAAGAGTRLGSDRPKALTLVAGRPMLDWLLDRHLPHVDFVVLVASPNVESAMRAQLASRGVAGEVVVQASATGMLDAIRLAEPALRARAALPSWVWITWCDQLAISASTAMQLAAACDDANADDAVVAMPTVLRNAPYIHLERDTEDRIARILQARERDAMPARGEGDAGLFALSQRAFFEALPRFDAEEAAARGAGTGERNFLPFLPWLRGRGQVVTFPVADEIESVGINTREELLRIEAHLLSVRAGSGR